MRRRKRTAVVAVLAAPNSFVYRYVPNHRGDLANGKLQVLQVLSGANAPITQGSQTPLNSPDQLALRGRARR